MQHVSAAEETCSCKCCIKSTHTRHVSAVLADVCRTVNCSLEGGAGLKMKSEVVGYSKNL